MKLTLSLLLLVMILSCKNERTDNKKPSIVVNAYKIRSYDSVDFSEDRIKTYDLKFSVLNKGNKPVSFWIMSCSWFNNFMTNRKYAHILEKECNHNVPKTIDLNPGDSAAYTSAVISYSQADTSTVRIGFIFIDGAKVKTDEEFSEIMSDASKQDQVFWSNEVKLHR